MIVHRSRSVAVGAVVLAVALVGACGSQPGTISTGDCGGVIGLAAPPCTCTSWTNHVIPTSDLVPGGVAVLVPDWSTVPPHADVKVAQRFAVSAVVIGRRPFDCNQGYSSNNVAWSSSDPLVLALDGMGTGARNDAFFVATAPGTARVAADNLTAPGGRVVRAELTACNRGATGNLQDAFICADRVPLVIRVVP
jgi:hypothetical protein